MKGFTGPSNPLYTLIFFTIAWLFGRKKRRRRSSSSSATLAAIKKDNLRRMQDLTARFEGYTAEVIPFFVSGQQRVGIIRGINLGNKVYIRLINDEIKFFVGDQYVSTLHPDSESRLEQILRDNVRFSAFLGGRDLEYRIFNNREFGSLLIYYKLPGVPPTKVEPKG